MNINNSWILIIEFSDCDFIIDRMICVNGYYEPP